jgi:2-polyprenyl-3-methyl-5-hydroxy-6-metoxy-1,4-benzoquinol methylase
VDVVEESCWDPPNPRADIGPQCPDGGCRRRPYADGRYDFGANWRRFLRNVGPDQILAAERSLLAILGPLGGRSFIDVACGSGLFSLAALRLGAERVHSFDFDPERVACTEAFRAAR